MTRHQKKHSVQTQTASSPRRSSAAALLLAIVGALFMAVPHRAQQQGSAPQKAQEQTIRIASEEVLLDIVARDKRGRPVNDLKAEELEVYEDGVRQQVASFRKVDRTLPAEAGEAPAAGAKPAAATGAGRTSRKTEPSPGVLSAVTSAPRRRRSSIRCGRSTW